ncbi:N-acetyltransferase family protein [Janibacter sp. G368]|uniref:GNAT family N-acetyltransferase n=1 Tax=Janibacter sp. G368 TaxID=3420441 RepID=UPI003D01216A
MFTTIAPLVQDDAAVPGRLHNALWRSTYAGLLPDEVLAARDDESSVRRWQERARAHEGAGVSPEGGRTLVAHDGAGAPIGWATVGPPRDASPPTPVELWSLYVAADHHGRGVAQALVAAALPDAQAAHLWVLVGNDRAISFYRKVGFVPDGVTEHDDAVGADDLRMVRPTPPDSPGAVVDGHAAYTGGCRRG